MRRVPLRRFGCCFPERCCRPDPRSEGDCVGVEMMEDLFAEAPDEEGDSY